MSRPSPKSAIRNSEVRNLFFLPRNLHAIAVTVLGPLNGFTLDRSRLAC
jgi:hypothetical protein